MRGVVAVHMDGVAIEKKWGNSPEFYLDRMLG